MLEGEADFLEEEQLFAILEEGHPQLAPQPEVQTRLKQSLQAARSPLPIGALEADAPDVTWSPPTEQIEQFTDALFAAGGQQQRREVREHFFDRWVSSDWFAQQGAICVFVALIIVYCIGMTRIERKFGVED